MVAERFKATVLKTVGGAEPSVGSNPTPSAIEGFPSGVRVCERVDDRNGMLPLVP